MLGVFIHDHVFKTCNGNYYSEGQLKSNTWQRYLSHIDELIVIARKIPINEDAIPTYNLASCDRVTFKCIEKIAPQDRLFTSKIDNYLESIIINCDFVICRLPSFLGVRAFYVAKRLNKKILIELVGCPYDAYKHHGSLVGALLAPLEKYKLKYILSQAKHTVYVTKYFLQERYPTSGNSIDISNVELLAHESQYNNRFCNNEKPFKISFIGSLNAKYKGLTDLILAISKLDNPIIELHILGSGNKEHYMELAKKLGVYNQLTFYKPIAGGKAVLEWLSQFDLYIQPSHTEGLPRALIEAMSVGLPCIGSRVGGIPELLTGNSLFKAKDSEELSHKIELFMNDMAFRYEQSELNLLTSKNYFLEILSAKRTKFFNLFFS